MKDHMFNKQVLTSKTSAIDKPHLPVKPPAEEEKKKHRCIFWWFFLAAFLLLGLAIGGRRLGLFYYPWESRAIVGSNLKSGRPPGMSDEEWELAMQKEADASRVSFSINGKPSFDDGSSPGSLFISNPVDNSCDLEVSIFLEANGELLYESGTIPPDHYVDYDRLLIALEQGIHPATAYMKFYNGRNLMNAVSISLEIYIDN